MLEDGKYVTVRTLEKNGEPRNVTLDLGQNGAVYLLGSLAHCARIFVDQKLVDDLQELVDAIEARKVLDHVYLAR